MLCINDKLAEIGPFMTRSDDELLICRCEEVTKGELRRAVHEGIFTLEEMRRWLRNGMGLCQGQTCTLMVKGILARELDCTPDQIAPATARAPMRPTEMQVLALDGGEKA